MDSNAVYITRPFLKEFRQAKTFWDTVLIAGSLLGSFLISWLNGGFKQFQAVSGEVLMAAGMIPVLLSLPLILADWTIGLKNHSKLDKLCLCYCWRDFPLGVAYVFYMFCLVIGIVLLTDFFGHGHQEENLHDAEEQGEQNEVLAAVGEILAEVGIIYGITTLLGVPSVETDDTKPFLTKEELSQVQRSGTIHAPYAPATDFVLVNACGTRVPDDGDGDKPYEDEVHDWMDYHYPSDVDKDYTEVSDLFKEQREEFGASGQERELASEILMDTPPGWDSSWYVAALGYCDHEKIPDLIPGLLSFVSGAAFPKDRYIVQAAITSLGNLYFGTQSRRLSQRLIYMWMTHEISNIRDHCAVAIEAIGDPLCVSFLKQMQNLKELQGCEVTENYYSEFMLQTDPLRASSLTEISEALSHRGSFDVRMMYLVRACDLLGQSGSCSLPELSKFIAVSGNLVLSEPLESHAVKQVCLEATRRAVIQCKQICQPWEGSSIRQTVFENCNWACRTSVFKQVRNAAKDVLQEAEYPYMCIYPCFDTKGATNTYQEEGITSEVVSDVLFANMGALYNELAEKVNSWSDPYREIIKMFDDQEDSLRTVAANSMTNPVYDPVMLLYIYLAETEHPSIEDYHIQERLNAVDRFERYVGLVAIAQMGKRVGKLKEQVLPQFTERELISDVRDLAEVVKTGNAAEDERGKCDGCIPQSALDLITGGDQGDKRNTFVEKEFALLKTRIQNPSASYLRPKTSRFDLPAPTAEDKVPLLAPTVAGYDMSLLGSGPFTTAAPSPPLGAAPFVSVAPPPTGALWAPSTAVGPASTWTGPVSTWTGPASTSFVPFSAMTGAVGTVAGPVSTENGPVSTVAGPVSFWTSPATASPPVMMTSSASSSAAAPVVLPSTAYNVLPSAAYNTPASGAVI